RLSRCAGDRYVVMSADLYRRVWAVWRQTEGVVGRGQRFVDTIIKKGVLIVKNSSRNDRVIDREDHAAASAVNVTIKGGTIPNQKISITSEGNVTVDK